MKIRYNKLSYIIFPKCKETTLLLGIFLISLIVGNIYSWNSAIAQTEDSILKDNRIIAKDLGKEVPELKGISEGKDIDFDPYIYVQNQTITQIGTPNLFETQTQEQTQLTMKHGDKISLEYGKQPLNIRAYLIDYDTNDLNEIYPIKQIDYSTIMISEDVPYGLKNLEIRCIYDNNEEITYTTSVNIEPQDVIDENNDED